MIVAGIDEAGKGSVIGPLVVCGFRCKDDEVDLIREIGVRDSKKIQREKREKIAKILMDTFDYEIIILSAEEINERMENETINDILRDCCLKLIKNLNADLTYVDSFDVKAERLKAELENKSSKRVVAMHKGERIEVVAAASIIAKYYRDKLIDELKSKFGDFGSGYPSDRKTIEWLKRDLNYELNIVRKKWKTLKRLNQKTLSDF